MCSVNFKLFAQVGDKAAAGLLCTGSRCERVTQSFIHRDNTFHSHNHNQASNLSLLNNAERCSCLFSCLMNNELLEESLIKVYFVVRQNVSWLNPILSEYYELVLFYFGEK